LQYNFLVIFEINIFLNKKIISSNFSYFSYFSY